MLTKFLSVILLLMSSVFALSAQNKKVINDEFSSLPNAKELVFEGVLVTDQGFPTGAFSITNADYFINTFKTWSKANTARHKALVFGTQQAQRVTLIRENYYRLSADQQQAFKDFLSDMEKFTSMQNAMTSDDKKVYLLTSADFKKIQSILQK